jgi:hypothetical protein
LTKFRKILTMELEVVFIWNMKTVLTFLIKKVSGKLFAFRHIRKNIDMKLG